VKLALTLTVVSLSFSFLLFHTNSFTVAEIKNETKLSVVSEEEALIAITYTQGKQFTVTNNTDKTIELTNVELVGGSDQEIIPLGNKGEIYINPGGVHAFNITGDPKDLTGKVLIIKAYWNGGSAEIKTTIPNLHGNQK
jgi:hypothetical protein